jgi:hypothetical protein
MPDQTTITQPTIIAVAKEMLRLELSDSDRRVVTELLNNLESDMAACKRLDVGVLEPAIGYHPRIDRGEA